MARKSGSHAEITGPKVLKAAERLFARHGFAAVTMRQIAAEVGVQAGALYLYTRDKQSLLADLMLAHLRELLAALPAPDPDPRAALEGFVRFHILHHLSRRDAVFVAYMELRSLNPENFAAVEELRRAYEDHLETIVQRGMAAGVFRPRDSRLATLALIAMLTGVTTWYREGGRLLPEAVAEQYIALACDTLGAGAGQSRS
ncbi:TetR/AcrR family transcriptional regulator [Falsigemmobacter intermedius]|uniref:TetR/AcrR family transcriptional regulator n=1 Tax=Falsigemmobacter intermedius TaxID=1553448 RepID=A0A444MCQ3_9RHOB|nr:TetR/AcrR family transcriptional regulator [Falsigemmobacter intermedius]RWY41797.1 TetR/AcrR family transcriptional regulator [Falsigemmobacter intermedius]